MDITAHDLAPAEKGKPLNGENYFKRKKARNRRDFLLLAAPALLWFTALMGWPLLNMFYISLLRWNGSILRPHTFVWFDNYKLLFTDPRFWAAMKLSLLQVGIGVPGVMFPAFALGFFLSQRKPGYRILRIIFFSPSLISISVLSLMFWGIYLPEGLLNGMLKFIGLSSLTHAWLAESGTVMGALIALDIWGGIGYNAVLFFAVLSNLSKDLIEAAQLDGAGPWTIMWKIAFPLTLDYFGILATFQLLWSLTWSGQNILLLTKGGPGVSSTTLSYLMYELGFVQYKIGTSQMVAAVLFVLGMLAVLAIRRFTRKNNA
jgi:multiple sugar transport system permease protein